MKQKSFDFSSDYVDGLLRKASTIFKWARLTMNGVAIISLSVAQFANQIGIKWIIDNSVAIFIFGVILLAASAILISFADKNDFDLVAEINRNEARIKALNSERDYLERLSSFSIGCQTASRLLSELVDECLSLDTVNQDVKSNVFSVAVEVIADYREKVFQIGSEYCNISIYEFNPSTQLLECIACFRSVPSDAVGPHRSWAVGEGHVGKAFQLRQELVCGDATKADVRPWISAPPEKFDTQDEDRYVSLAAVPLGLKAEDPLGVLIVTSSKPLKFGTSDEGFTDDEAVERRNRSSSAIQDFASQISQMMAILRERGINREEDANEANTVER